MVTHGNSSCRVFGVVWQLLLPNADIVAMRIFQAVVLAATAVVQVVRVDADCTGYVASCGSDASLKAALEFQACADDSDEPTSCTQLECCGEYNVC